MSSYEELKERVAELKRDQLRAEGSLSHLLEQLKNDFNCDSLEEARAYLVDLKQQLADAQEQLDQDLADFQEKHKDVLSEV